MLFARIKLKLIVIGHCNEDTDCESDKLYDVANLSTHTKCFRISLKIEN